MIDLDKSIFNISIDTPLPHIGSMLVAEPFLREQYFNHAVICLIDYFPGKSAMGVVMNKPSGYKLEELISNIQSNEDIEVYCGGPVSCDRLFFLHRIPQFISNSTKIAEGLYVGGDFEDVVEYINDGLPVEDNIRFFVGYSGWDAGQLDSELRNHVWATTDIPSNFNPLSYQEDSYWHKVVKSLGNRYTGWRYQPMNPSDN
ncbi:MAG: YqgE/AlgH family protein [Muribaculaceae bacterium]|nr:YqgE/AlgH family protein [Muribaculaceae bacterium]MDE5844993.1 YqgE/AlgH family protein [Muribaculaceae bacterium]